MLSSLQNPLVKNLRKLHKVKERHRQHSFLIEGTHLIEEAIATRYPIDTVCCTPAWHSKYPLLWQQLEEIAKRSERVTDELMDAIATTVHPDGIVASAPRRFTSLLGSSQEGYIEQQTKELDSYRENLMSREAQFSMLQLGIALETIQDPGNLGTIIRSAVAGHADGLWLSADSVDLDHPKVLRASAGQWFHLSMTTSDSLVDVLNRAQKNGVQIVATQPDAQLSYWHADLTRPTIILAGNEGAGLSNPLKAMADIAVRIPTSSVVESLNVAIAVSLLIFEANRQRNVKEFSGVATK